MKHPTFYFLSLILSITFASGHYLYGFDFPRPTGPFAVGTISYHLKDESRVERFSYRGIDARELMVQAWYPAQGRIHKPCTPYIPHIVPYLKEALKKKTYLPMFALNLVFKDAYTYAQEGIALLADPQIHKFPVIIFSHGIGSSANFYTTQMETLASYGYVVIGINHTYDAFVSIFPDGQRIIANEDYEENIFKYLMRRTSTWVEDVHFVLNELNKINTNDPKKIFTNKLDLENIGMFGHSMGGSVTTQVCRRDPRVKAGVNMDGPLFGENATEPFDKPFMFLLAHSSFGYAVTSFLNHERVSWGISLEEEAEFRKRYISYIPALCCNINKNIYSIIIRDTDHNTFSDLPLFKESSWFFKLIDLSTGSINAHLSIEIISSYLVSFFDKYLKKKSAPLLEVYCQRYGENVIMQKWK